MTEENIMDNSQETQSDFVVTTSRCTVLGNRQKQLHFDVEQQPLEADIWHIEERDYIELFW